MMKNSRLSYERNNGLVRLHDLEGLKILNDHDGLNDLYGLNRLNHLTDLDGIEDLKVLYDIERIAPAISRARKKTTIKNCMLDNGNKRTTLVSMFRRS